MPTVPLSIPILSSIASSAASEGNRKFHIRTYVLAVGSLRVYVFREMLALFAEKEYKEPWDASSIDDLTRHLTNTCIQDTAGLPTYNSVKRFWSLPDDAPGVTKPDWKHHVYEQICCVTGEIFKAAARGMLVHFQTLPNAFELFGVDFLVDHTGNAWLLELNAFPDFKQTGDELRDRVVGKLFEAVVDAAVKPFFGLQSEAAGLAVKEETKARLNAATPIARCALQTHPHPHTPTRRLSTSRVRLSEEAQDGAADRHLKSLKLRTGYESFLRAFGLEYLGPNVESGVEIDENGRLHVVSEFEARQKHKTALLLSRAPLSLTEKDFYGLLSKGRFFAGWRSRGGLEK
ncbi:Aminolevulinate dehydratase, partial [Ascosphaera pollenicola]